MVSLIFDLHLYLTEGKIFRMKTYPNPLGLKIDLDCEKCKFALTFISIMTAAFLINIFVLIYFTWKRKYQKSYHQAYMNLAVSDAAMALFGVIFRGRSK